MTFKRALFYSFLLHVFIITMLGNPLGCGSQPSKGQKQASEDHRSGTGEDSNQKEIIPKAKEFKDVEVELVDLGPGYKTKIKKPKHAKEECKGGKFFGGIGVQTSPFDQVIDIVVEGYPAKDAGLEPGDQILEPRIKGIRGEIGTTVNLTIRKKDGSIIQMEIVRDKICTK